MIAESTSSIFCHDTVVGNQGSTGLLLSKTDLSTFVVKCLLELNGINLR